jgi:hypothetical protein
VPGGEHLPHSLNAAETALAIEPRLAAARMSLGAVKAFQAWDWRWAEREFRLALDEPPGAAHAHYLYAYFCLMPAYGLVGKAAEAPLAERRRNGRRQERFFGTGALPNFFRKPFGAGWALVGDAGYHKDPITAQGITDAFRDVELLADAIDAGLSERARLQDALAAYEQSRNDAAMPMYRLTCDRVT